MRVALCQINTTVGDFDGNRDKVLDYAARAHAAGAQLAVFPEMTLTGYPPRDLLERAGFADRCQAALNEVVAATARYPGLGVVVGGISRNLALGKPLFNDGVLAADGQVLSTHRKSLLPNYDVFDEERYFEPAAAVLPAAYAGVKLGVTVCEDIWNDKQVWTGGRYRVNPIRDLAREGVELLLNLSASPFSWGKGELRYDLLAGVARDNALPILYVNQVGGNDSLIFDGRSLAIAADGTLLGAGAAFEEDLLIVDVPLRGEKVVGDPEAQARLGGREDDDLGEIHRALVLGLRDYTRKCGFRQAVIGLSGGIDSAVTAVLAADALGPENVLGVFMPTRFTSELSRVEAAQLAANLGIGFKVVPIDTMFQAYLNDLAAPLEGLPGNATEENIQARIRGNVLMAISNRFGHLLLSTGNKSEIAVGYCTLYGDMCGGLCVISDLYKTEVYRLARHFNERTIRIPEGTIRRPPSAELKPDQKDQDTLPPYEMLDAVLRRYVDENMSPDAIVESGFDEGLVRGVVRRIETNEYKRQQAALGLRVSWKAFGMGRRYPIARKL